MLSFQIKENMNSEFRNSAMKQAFAFFVVVDGVLCVCVWVWVCVGGGGDLEM